MQAQAAGGYVDFWREGDWIDRLNASVAPSSLIPTLSASPFLGDTRHDGANPGTNRQTRSRNPEFRVLARSGRRAEAEQIVRGLLETQNPLYSPANLALVYAGLGNRESAVKWLDKGYEGRDVQMLFLTIDPKWHDLRSDPGFQKVLKRCLFVLPQSSVQKPAGR